ncbi:hypothetical protein X975_24999, partial [Stegodyphus mimosarum]
LFHPIYDQHSGKPVYFRLSFYKINPSNVYSAAS